MIATKPSSNPYNPSLKLHCTTSPPYHDFTQYQRLVFQLIYLTTTLPNIPFDVQ